MNNSTPDILVDDWYFVNRFAPVNPGGWGSRLCGIVTNHPEIVDNSFITTSRVVDCKEENGKTIVITRTGTNYVLGDVSKQYEELFPNALNTLKDVIGKRDGITKL
jgi:hypothetical protein